MRISEIYKLKLLTFFSTFWARATVCKTDRPMLSDRCLSVCPVCDVCALWLNGWMDQDETWHAGRPRPSPHCVRWAPSSPPQRCTAPSTTFVPFLLWPNGWIHQAATWYGCRSQPRGLYVRLRPSPPSPKRGQAPKFLAHVYCGQTTGWIKMPLGTKVGLSPGDCVRWGPSPLPTKGVERPSQFSAHFYCGQTAGCINIQ